MGIYCSMDSGGSIPSKNNSLIVDSDLSENSVALNSCFIYELFQLPGNLGYPT